MIPFLWTPNIPLGFWRRPSLTITPSSWTGWSLWFPHSTRYHHCHHPSWSTVLQHTEGSMSIYWRVFIARVDVEAETPILWPPDAKSWERLRAGGEGDNRGWDGWMALPTRWTWVWVDSGSWWWMGRPGMLRFMVSQRVGHDWVTELNWTQRAKQKVGSIFSKEDPRNMNRKTQRLLGREWLGKFV